LAYFPGVDILCR